MTMASAWMIWGKYWNAIKDILNSPTGGEQRVDNDNGNKEPPGVYVAMLPKPKISEAPAIMHTRDPMAKRNLITTARTHRRITGNNTREAVPAIQRVAPVLILPDTGPTTAKRQSTRVRTNAAPVIIIRSYQMLGG